MATTKKAAEAPQPPAPMTPDEAVASAVATVRAPYEAMRAAQAKAEADKAEPKGD
ncbi:MAG TPA: hypothetical protein VIQ30_15610 [Pseudonocardia sp.]